MPVWMVHLAGMPALALVLLLGTWMRDDGLVGPIKGVLLACHKYLLNFCLQHGIHSRMQVRGFVGGKIVVSIAEKVGGW
jgi:hypothetical protein